MHGYPTFTRCDVCFLAPPVGPKVVMAEPASEWLMPGSVVEVTMQEEGLVGMKATATVVALDGKKVQIEHDAFNDEASRARSCENG